MRRIFFKQLLILFNIDIKNLILYSVAHVSTAILPLLNVYILSEFLNNIAFNKGILMGFILKYTVLAVFVFCSEQMISYTSDILQLKIGYYLINEIVKSSEGMTLEEFENSDNQNKFRRVIENSISAFVSSFSLYISIISGIMSLIFSLIFISQWNTWIVMLFFAYPIVFYNIYLNILNKNYEIEVFQTKRAKENWYITFLLTQDTAFKENKIFKFSAHLLQKYQKNIGSFVFDTKLLFNYGFKRLLVMEIINLLILFSVIFLAINATNSSRDEILIGNLVAIVQVIYRILDISRQIGTNFIALKKNQLYLIELMEVLKFQENIDNIRGNDRGFKVCELYLNNISYIKNGRKLLNNISLKISAPNFYYIVGKNGSGKTTLLNIINGLYDVTVGDIYMNGEKIVSTQKLRDNVSCFFQDFKKYEYSLKDNIILSDINAKDIEERLEKVIQLLSLENLISNLNNGINTNLGTWFDNSVNLSGGEWQKLAITRTLFRNNEIYCLDEPNSMLDYANSSMLIRVLKNIAKYKLVFVVNHKNDLIQDDDNVIFIDEGMIKGIGKHQELLSLSNYKKVIDKE